MKYLSEILEYEATYAYTLAWSEELEIEAELCDGKITPQRAEILRKCLRQIDKWKGSEEYEGKILRVRKSTPHVTSFPEISDALAIFSSVKFASEPNAHAENFVKGMKSTDEEQRREFEDFAEAATGLMSMTPLEALPLLRPLKRATGEGHRRKLSPPWRNEAPGLDMMRLLIGSGKTPNAASKEVAAGEGLAHEESRARSLRKRYKERMTIRI